MEDAFWDAGRKQRLRVRGAIAGAGLVIGTLVWDFRVGLVLGVLAGLADLGYHWSGRYRSRVWRTGTQGPQETTKILRRNLRRRRGYTVLHRVKVPGHPQIDHIVIGRNGIWTLQSRAYALDTTLAAYGGKLFIGERTAPQLTAELRTASEAFAEMLSDKLGHQVQADPVIVVHGGELPRGGTLTVDGVTLVRAMTLGRWIRRHPETDFTPAEVQEIIRTTARLLPLASHW
ncbi:nuclease-related domain-containing protein [Rhizohabitans arisaemae]|uniref:nuclease-related domain-containing protein n=1 Tax=Rhizohabitans arisaemae TaxID=2720610 RepID=UPI0024B208E8|nr:nuclease-related domain-containing protein [Rhizohabitans arisaemae]